jgi:tetratricopeptide (TPR) repeat protein
MVVPTHTGKSGGYHMKTGFWLTILILLAFFACAVPSVAVDDAISLYNRADQFITVGDYASALPLLDQALALNTSDFVSSGVRTYALVDKSKAQIELGDYNGALNTLDQALATEETDKLWNNKGYVLFRLGRYDEALRAYNTAIRITPTYTVALINKGDTLMKMERYQDALDAYNLALGIDMGANDLTFEQKAKTWKDLGDACFNVGRYDDAITAYKNVLSINPAYPGAAAGLASAEEKASAPSPFLILGIIALVAAVGAGVFYVMKKKRQESGKDEKPKKKK